MKILLLYLITIIIMISHLKFFKAYLCNGIYPFSFKKSNMSINPKFNFYFFCFLEKKYLFE